jgi:hypothetical protein
VLAACGRGFGGRGGADLVFLEELPEADCLGLDEAVEVSDVFAASATVSKATQRRVRHECRPTALSSSPALRSAPAAAAS